MSWIILKQPHPLDAIWSQAMEAVSDAQHAVDAQPEDFSDAQNDALCAVLLKAIAVVIALPARDLSDSLVKLDLSGLGEDGPLSDFDHHEIMREACALADAAIVRGGKLLKAVPNLLEGVTL
ncbi:hypothetical protein ACFOKF_16415 [Sphingobium rhizovicinum]|uniref:Uncharacterized protein n=1 Tax=Sphingobium rhizovicinum TaxID=432308 RepID=A0ABV7NK67_9SPHN